MINAAASIVMIFGLFSFSSYADGPVSLEWLAGRHPGRNPSIAEAVEAWWISDGVYVVDWGSHLEYMDERGVPDGD